MPNFSELLKQHYEQTPDKVSVILLHAGQPDRPVTYRELVHGAAGYARTLEKNGVQPGDVVPLILQHGADLLFAYFGAVLHGAIPSIMPFLTEKLLPERYRADLAALVAVTQPTTIVTYREFEPEVRAALKPGEDSVKAVIVSGQADGPREPDFVRFGGLQRQPEDIALLQHSSGTTGLQKGVALSHQAVVNQLTSYGAAIHLDAADVFVSWLPLYHDMGLIACWLMPILLGSPLVLLSPFDWVRAPYRLMQAVSKYRGTLSWLPNFAYNFCAQKMRDRDLEGVDLSCWRAISNCSEPMRWDSHQAFFERFRTFGLRHESLATCYAMAENVFAVTQGGTGAPVVFEDVDRESLQVEKIARPAADGKPVVRMLGAGKAIPGTQVRVVDAHGKSLPDRHVGEVALKSDCMLTGYYHRPDATEKAFKDGWYLTGDFGYLVDGELYITGRKKDLIIVGGKNIYPQDLELLAYEVPGVHTGRASAFGVFNDATGTEDVVLAAEADTDDHAERQRIADGIRAAVTRGSAVALRYVHIVGRHWMVKTSSGKTARSANREKFLKEMEEKGQGF
ncbi:MAG: AMP-dependent synthetase and ligase [Anaerolineaceae bacterium]|nr:MAG: AMP-dependent synthetase and ligase [Anaerolineaceae bacterium]